MKQSLGDMLSEQFQRGTVADLVGPLLYFPALSNADLVRKGRGLANPAGVSVKLIPTWLQGGNP